MGRYTALALVVCLAARAASAQGVPAETIRRAADLNVQMEELRVQWNAKQIDSIAYNRDWNPLNEELKVILQQIRALPETERRQAESQIAGLTKARLAILQAQWRKENEQREAAAEERRQQAIAAVTPAVRAALEPQRQRITLQQRRERGDISAEEFAAEDQKALEEITAIREKYVAEHGTNHAWSFDDHLARQTRDLINNPTPAQKPGGAKPATAKPPAARTPAARSPVTQTPEQQKPGIDLTASPPLSTFTVFLYLATYYGQWLGLIALMVGVVWIFIKLMPGPPAPPKVSDTYGTAHFAPMLTEVQDDRCVSRGVFLGKSSIPEWRQAPPEIVVRGAPVCSTAESHTLIVAPTRTGKGTRVIIPTLLRYNGSALVIDPKGENAAVTARCRRDGLGQTVHIINPWGELAATYRRSGFSPATYNPLDCVDRSDPNAVAIAQALAEAICPPAADKRDQFWQGSAASILTAVFLWLVDQPGEAKTLARAREITSLSRKDFTLNFLTSMASSSSFGGAIRELSAQFVDMPDATYGGVMAALNQSMKFLSDPQVKAATATSSFSMTDLIRERRTVYVVIPPDRIDTQKTWLRLVLAAGMHTFKRFPAAERPAGHRCLFLIDEFPALGRLEELPRDIATMSGYGLDLALVVQGLDQLKDHYHEARGTILSNCAYKWFCNISDLETAKWLSEALGKKTVGTVSRSESQNAGGAGSSVSHAETGRSLLNPDEVLNLGKDVAISIQPHGRPHFLLPVDYWVLQMAFSSLEAKYPRLFWNPPLDFDQNPYVSEAPGMTNAAN